VKEGLVGFEKRLVKGQKIAKFYRSPVRRIHISFRDGAADVAVEHRELFTEMR
jgi:hypothetical protein